LFIKTSCNVKWFVWQSIFSYQFWVNWAVIEKDLNANFCKEREEQVGCFPQPKFSEILHVFWENLFRAFESLLPGQPIF